MKTFVMDTQLEIGQSGEEWLAEKYGLTLSEWREWDLETPTGKKVELKTDTYDHNATGNFFIETESHGTLGGPYRSLHDGIDIFVYMFISPSRTIYIFKDLDLLCQKCDEYVRKFKPSRKMIRNVGWAAFGYAIPRKWLVENANGKVINCED